MVAGLGGPSDLLQRPDAHLAQAPLKRPVMADRRGVVTAIDTRALGLAVVALGGGRKRSQDEIDPAVGLAGLAGIGAEIAPDAPLAIVHARDEAQAEAAAAALRGAYVIGEQAAPRSDRTIHSRLEKPA